MAMKNCSIDSFTERNNFSQETQRKNSILNSFDILEQAKSTLKSPRSTNDIKQEIKQLKQGETSINKVFG